MEFLRMALSALQQGLVYGIVGLGVYITYKLLDFPDLSVDGTFPLGGAVCAVLIINGLNGWLAVLIATIAGGAAGFVTGLLHVKLRITNLLSGIIVMTALLSVNLQIAGGSLLNLIQYDTIFSNPAFNGLASDLRKVAVLAVLLALAVGIKLLFDGYLRTKSGFLLRAVGDNEQLITSLGKDVGRVKILGLTLANALVALGGGVYCQLAGNYDSSSGTGMVVIGIVCVIIGLVIFSRVRFLRPTTMVLLGGVIYSIFLKLAGSVGIDTGWMKLVNAVLFVVILCFNRDLFSFKRKKKTGGGR